MRTYATGISDRWSRFLGAIPALALLVPVAVMAQSLAPVNLGTAGNFVILAQSGISATGTTSIVGDIGVSPIAATAITGFGLIMDPSGTFSTSSLVTGRVYAANYTSPTPANLTTAVGNMQTAYTDAAGRPTPDFTELYSGDLTGRTLAPGLYKWGTGVQVAAGGVTLSGTASDVWIFQVGQNLTLASGAIVTLTGGAQASNIFWQVAGQVTIGTTAAMKGIILCQTAIVMSTGATLSGRALAQTAVTLNANAVTKPAIAPTLSSPVNNAANQATALTLSWNAASGAASYGLQVSTTSAFSTTRFNGTGLTTTTQAVGGLANGTIYYWRANATSAAGTSAWSGIWSFTTIVVVPGVPVLLLPANLAPNQATALTLTWAASIGAAAYSAQVSTISTFATTVSGQTGLTATSDAISGLANSTTYFWRVNATNSAGTSAWSIMRRFTTATGTAPPNPPTLVTPANGATGQAIAPALTWRASAGAASYGVQVSIVSTFATTVSNQSGLTAASAAVAGLAYSTTYFWRANAMNGAGTSAWSSAWRFTTVPVPVAPAAPVLASPANNVVNRPLTLGLSWSPVAGATTYGLQVATISTFSTTVYGAAGLTAASQTVGGLANGTVYYWRANAANAGGTSAWSGAWNFTTVLAVSVLSNTMVEAKPGFRMKNGALTYAIAQPSAVRIALYDMRGRNALIVEQMQSAGNYTLLLHGRVATGLYILYCKAGGIENKMEVMIAR